MLQAKASFHMDYVGAKEESRAGVVFREFCPSGRARPPSKKRLSGEEGDHSMEKLRGIKK